MNLSEIGLGILAIGWLYQLWCVYQGRKDMSAEFLGLYVVGVVVLVIDGYTNNLMTMALLNAVAAITALLILFKTRK